MIKRFFRKILLLLSGFVGWNIINLLFKTIKFDIRNQKIIDSTPHFILAFFHRHILIPLWILRNRNISVLISEHFDGEIIARIAEKSGNPPARGSSTRGFIKGLRSLIAISKKGNIGVTPDGPKGPVYSVQDGLIFLAKKTGCPIIGTAGNFKNKFIFRSWDNFIVPLPFTEGHVEFSKSLYYDSKLSFEENKKIIRQELINLADRTSTKFKIFSFESFWKKLLLKHKTVFKPLSFLYLLIIKIKNLLFDLNIFQSSSYPNLEIISFGNITVGGTGKTQLIEHYARTYLKGKNLIILSSGYKSKFKDILVVNKNMLPAKCGDEPLMLKRNIPQAMVIVSRNRIKTLNLLNKKFKDYTVLLDDAFHYRNIDYHNNNNQNITLIDVTENIFDEEVFPAGKLREPVNSLNRATTIILNKANFIKEEELNILINKLKKINPDAKYVKSFYKIEKIYNITEIKNCLRDFENLKLGAFCGIGNPDFFFKLLNENKIRLNQTLTFNDHTFYNVDELAHLKFLMKENDYLLTTEKDAVKLNKFDLLGSKIYAVKVELELSDIQ